MKIWSRAGQIRSTLATTDRPVYSVCWGPDSDSLMYCSGKDIIIKPLQSVTNKQIQWRAHEGTVLRADWSPINSNIVSGGEEQGGGRYKVRGATWADDLGGLGCTCCLHSLCSAWRVQR